MSKSVLEHELRGLSPDQLEKVGQIVDSVRADRSNNDVASKLTHAGQTEFELMKSNLLQQAERDKARK